MTRALRSTLFSFLTENIGFAKDKKKSLNYLVELGVLKQRKKNTQQ